MYPKFIRKRYDSPRRAAIGKKPNGNYGRKSLIRCFGFHVERSLFGKATDSCGSDTIGACGRPVMHPVTLQCMRMRYDTCSRPTVDASASAMVHVIALLLYAVTLPVCTSALLYTGVHECMRMVRLPLVTVTYEVLKLSNVFKK